MIIPAAQRERETHPPVHGNSREREDRYVDRDWLDEEHQVAHRAAEHPAAGVEGVGEGERHAGHTHEHVGEGQVSDEEVGDVVHFAGSTYDVEEQVVPKDAHHHHQHVARDDEGLERLQQGHVCKLGGAVGGAVLHHRHLVNVSPCLFPRHRAAAVALHGGGSRVGQDLRRPKHTPRESEVKGHIIKRVHDQEGM